MPQKKKYLWERKADDFLQFWPKESSQRFLQAQPAGTHFAGVPNSSKIYKPDSSVFDPLEERGILNSAIMKIGRKYYQEHAGEGFAHMGYVTRGSVFLKSASSEIRIKKGIFFCIPALSPYVLHTLEPWEGFWFHLQDNDFLKNRLKYGYIWQKSRHIKEMEFAIKQYLAELQNPKKSFELLDAYAELIEIYIRKDLSTSDDTVFSTFIAEVKARPARYASIREAAKDLGLSPYQLDKLCMKQIGVKFSKFLQESRMNLARKLIANENNFSKVAIDTGFADAFSFSKAFKSHHGCTPKEFKQKNGVFHAS